MPPFTSKQLYLMNGGNKTYIGRDGFADVYDATPAEPDLKKTLLAAADTPVPVRRIALATALWTNYKDESALQTVLSTLSDQKPETRNGVFAALRDFKTHPGIKKFLADALQSEDEAFRSKTAQHVALWGW